MTAAPTERSVSSVSPIGAGWFWTVITTAYFLATSLLHLQFSLLLVQPRDTPWGRHALAELVPAATMIGALFLVLFIARQWRSSAQPRLLGARWLLWALTVILIDRYLTYSTNEYFHYPEYALLAWLVARTLDPARNRFVPGRVLLWTALLGTADETLQYLWITASYSHYLDFNDLLVNVVAGIAGVLLYYGRTSLPPKPRVDTRTARWEIGVSLILVGLTAAALMTGRVRLSPSSEVPPGGLTRDARGAWTFNLQRRPDWYGSWQPGPYRGQHYVLTPLEGLLCSGIAGLLIVTRPATIARRFA